jgi:predicted CopG family antitoxin
VYYEEFNGVKPMSLSLSDLIAKSDEADRFRELMSLVDRAIEKLEDQDVKAKVEAPLKPIRVLLDARKRRPK